MLYCTRRPIPPAGDIGGGGGMAGDIGGGGEAGQDVCIHIGCSVEPCSHDSFCIYERLTMALAPIGPIGHPGVF